MAVLPMPEKRQQSIQTAHNGQQHHAKCQCQWQVTFAGFKRDGGGHHSRKAFDVAAHNHDGTHFRNSPTEASDHHREQGKALIPSQKDAPNGIASA
jgi:hypothetical protein